MMSRRRGDSGPRPLDGSLDALSNHLGLGGSLGLGRLFAKWEEIVGPAVSSHVQPVRLDKEALVVNVDHPAWATEVRHFGDDLLDRVAEATGSPRPDHLEVRVRR
jgi:predicted nucleic acid-binding Zn ribbon protein